MASGSRASSLLGSNTLQTYQQFIDSKEEIKGTYSVLGHVDDIRISEGTKGWDRVMQANIISASKDLLY